MLSHDVFSVFRFDVAIITGSCLDASTFEKKNPAEAGFLINGV
ncbi:hypothetical protein phiAS5_ORF0085 [Aeromonas phage phiAS5]|uniref:Uncharacterized protein n=1 Tax=Aeromonas phage phiAS5 TaxID=879630 RepID=E1A2I2_9CAUD|nr:hypothetical protein phiAS5_ORF0085 [Aeromonas phage phiAS5]ADM79928.1 hypothetical protein phiAS5_ORF0085 [Aeromonas phage phiAS5]